MRSDFGINALNLLINYLSLSVPHLLPLSVSLSLFEKWLFQWRRNSTEFFSVNSLWTIASQRWAEFASVWGLLINGNSNSEGQSGGKQEDVACAHTASKRVKKDMTLRAFLGCKSQTKLKVILFIEQLCNFLHSLYHRMCIQYSIVKYRIFAVYKHTHGHTSRYQRTNG